MPAFVSFKFVSNSLDTLIIENFCTSQLSVKWQSKGTWFSLASEFVRPAFLSHETAFCWTGFVQML